MGKQKEMAFRDLGRLVYWLKVSLALLALSSIFMALSSWLQINLLEKARDGVDISADAAANDWREAISGGIYAIAYFATSILFLRWTYLGNKNASSLGAKGMQFSPGWSVGNYFLPFWNLWKPYEALKETFKASNPAFKDNWKSSPHPALLPLWWTIWIISCLVGQIIFRTTWRADSIADYIAASWINMLSVFVDLPLFAVVWLLVSRLHAWQTAKLNVQDSLG